ncbi:hypothetical protein ACLOJK_013234 [Asimina triloba]
MSEKIELHQLDLTIPIAQRLTRATHLTTGFAKRELILVGATICTLQTFEISCSLVGKIQLDDELWWGYLHVIAPFFLQNSYPPAFRATSDAIACSRRLPGLIHAWNLSPCVPFLWPVRAIGCVFVPRKAFNPLVTFD